MGITQGTALPMLVPTGDVLTALIPGSYNPRGVHVGPVCGSGSGSMSPAEGSVSQWLGPLQEGNPEAAQKLCECYFKRLIELARKKLRALPHREAAEDVALSAFDSFCRGAARGRFPELADRDSLWRLLVVITARKAARHKRDANRHKRGGRVVGIVSASADADIEAYLGQVVDREPTPEFAAQAAEECRHLMRRLGDPELDSIALLRMEGYTVEEIGERLNYVPRTIKRKLRLIRSLWEQELNP
jgi:DNA-directed RNA polymerase specialized sigma24 family protein